MNSNTNLSSNAAIRVMCCISLAVLPALVGCKQTAQVFDKLTETKEAKLDKNSPTSFVRSAETDWTTMPIRQGMTARDALIKAADIISMKYDVEMIDRESIVFRTQWKVSRTFESNTIQYRVRIQLRASQERDRLLIKAEARYGDIDVYREGWDRNVLEDLQLEINRVVGPER
ncbi:MAG: hypothetical protein FWG12_06815 [Holophagaceae bacterium]|nr:hypothetical protein [Holophagaceae bacterium]